MIGGTGNVFSAGVALYGGGSINNSGSISGYDAVKTGNTAATLTNSGTITGIGGSGVYLRSGGGGSISNSGSISGINGVRGGDAAVTVTNTGTIAGASNGTGVSLFHVGNVSNTTSTALISGAIGVSLIAAGSTVVNAGTISGTYEGVVLIYGGSVSNSGLIRNTLAGVNYNGVEAFNGAASVTNTGTITSAGIGVYLKAGGSISNSGAISGVTGIYGKGTSFTLTNYGSITGTGGTALSLNAATNLVTLGTGSVLSGKIDGHNKLVAITLKGSGALASTITNMGTLSSLTVNSGASWVASGSWAIPTVTNSGTLQPGIASTPLNVTGNFTQGSTGVLKTFLTSTGGASLLNITGNATLAGSVLVVAPASISSDPTKYTIVPASGTLSGTFASVSGGTALLLPTLSYDANHAYVTLTQQALGIAAATQSSNENDFAKAFDAAYAANPALFAGVLNALDHVPTQAELNNLLNQLTGENSSVIPDMVLDQILSFIDQFQQHSASTLAGAPDDPWITGFFQSGTFNGNGNAHDVHQGTSGMTLGADHVIFPGFRLGAMFGMGAQHANVGGGVGTSRLTYEQVAVTADYVDGALFLNGMFGMAYSHGTTIRAITLPGLTATAIGQPKSNQLMGSAEAGYAFPLDATFNLVPFASIALSSTDQHAYAETGAGALNLTFAAHTFDNQRSTIGARLKGTNVALGSTLLMTELKLGWSHEFANLNPSVTATFSSATANSFTVTGAPLPRDAGVIGLGVGTAIADNASIHLRYDGEFSGRSSSNTISGGISIDW